MAKLHPTLKACHCGYIGTKREVYRHIDVLLSARRQGAEDPQIFWSQHGEVPLNEDDPRVADLEQQLTQSLTRQQVIDSL